MALYSTKKSLQEELKNLDGMLLSGTYGDDMEVEDVLQLRQSAVQKMADIDMVTKRKRANLGVDGQANLKKLINNKFLQAQMNAHALKLCIRSRLRDRKFELTRVEWAYRHSTSNGKWVFYLHEIYLIPLREKAS